MLPAAPEAVGGAVQVDGYYLCIQTHLFINLFAQS